MVFTTLIEGYGQGDVDPYFRYTNRRDNRKRDRTNLYNRLATVTDERDKLQKEYDRVYNYYIIDDPNLKVTKAEKESVLSTLKSQIQKLEKEGRITQEIKNDIAFTYDILTALLLFFLIYLFSYLRENLDALNMNTRLKNTQINQFIKIKKIMASALIPIFIGIGLFTFGSWVTYSMPSNISAALKDVNSLFFDDFFAVLIIVDV